MAGAFGLALFIRDTANPFAHSWLAFFYAGIAVLLFSGQHRFSAEPLAKSLLGLLLWMALSAFVLRVTGLSAWFFCVLSAPALYAIAMMRADAAEVLHAHVIAIGIPLSLVALVTVIDAWEGRFTGWPLLNPNNLAAMMAVGFIGACALARDEDRMLHVAPFVALFAAALVACNSRAAAAAAAFALVAMSRSVLVFVGSAAAVVAIAAGKWGLEGLFATVQARLDLWRVSVEMVFDAPLFGWGMGTWQRLYPAYIDHAQATAGYFAHNDPLQMAVEMGIPAAVLFYACCLFAFRRVNGGFFCLLALITHTHVSFDLYVPAAAVLAGLCLAAWFTEDSWRSTDPS